MRVKNQPANLYISLDRRTGRYRCQYKHPITGKFHGLGSDPAQAAKDAKYLNAQLGNARLDRIVAATGMPVARWLRDYRKIQDQRLRDGEIAAATHRQRLWMVARLAALQYKQARDGYLWLEQEKTGFRLAIPLGLELLDMGTVGAAIKATRGRILSRWVLHHTKPRAFAERGAAVHVDTISRNFARARRLAGLDAPNAPTFHEQRSLALRLYAEAGVDAKALGGHKTDRMAAQYQDSRGAEWVIVGA